MTSSPPRRWPTAARASSTSCTKRSGESSRSSPCAARSVPTCRSRCCTPTARRTSRALRPAACTSSIRRTRMHATTYGVGQAIGAALDAGARRIVVGLGGSATNDGGAGLLAALGATADVPLDAGPAALSGVTQVDLAPARSRLRRCRARHRRRRRRPAARHVRRHQDIRPAEGPDGRADHRRRRRCSTASSRRRAARRRPSVASPTPRAPAPRAGSGFALMLLGGSVVSGIDLVADAVGLTAQAGSHDLVVTGEGTYDFSSRAGKVVFGVAAVAGCGRPAVHRAGGPGRGRLPRDARDGRRERLLGRQIWSASTRRWASRTPASQRLPSVSHVRGRLGLRTDGVRWNGIGTEHC